MALQCGFYRFRKSGTIHLCQIQQNDTAVKRNDLGQMGYLEDDALTDSRVFRSGFSAVRNSCNLPSSASLFVILSDGEYEVPSTGLLILNKPYHEAQFKIVSTSNTAISSFQ